MTPTLPLALLRRPALVWLAVLIAVFAALMPTLAHARASGTASQTMVYCTSSGVQEVASQRVPDVPGGQESAPRFEHCPFCLPHTDRAVLPLHSQVHRFAVLSDEPVPTDRQAFFFPAQSAFRPPSRGPPGFLLFKS